METQRLTAGRIRPSDRLSQAKKLGNRRKHPRIPVDIPASIFRHGTFRAVRICNISQGGLMLKGAFNLFPGDRLVVKTLRGREFHGVVVWSLGTHCGMQFDRLLHRMDPILKPSANGGERARQ